MKLAILIAMLSGAALHAQSLQVALSI